MSLFSLHFFPRTNFSSFDRQKNVRVFSLVLINHLCHLSWTGFDAEISLWSEVSDGLMSPPAEQLLISHHVITEEVLNMATPSRGASAPRQKVLCSRQWQPQPAGHSSCRRNQSIM